MGLRISFYRFELSENSMKKRIAVYANGWSSEALRQALAGMREYAAAEDYDIFVFVSYASYSEHANLNQGELNIYNLNEVDNYDGIIVFSTMLNSGKAAEELFIRAKDKNVPIVSIGVEADGIPSVCVKNEEGMRDLVTHLVEVHNVKNVLFMGGTPDHPDSQARLNVTREVLEAHGLSLGDDQVCYGEWGNDGPISIIGMLHRSGKPLPDAIVCANDIMALAASSELLRLGYTLPDDVIVTGFDNVIYGKVTYPALSTVKQNYEEIGQLAFNLICSQVRGERVEEKSYINASFVNGESCGCTANNEFKKYRLRYCQHSYQSHLDSSTLEIVERVMRNRISGMNSYQHLRDTLQDHFFRNHAYEGPNYYLVLNSAYYNDPMAMERDICTPENQKDYEVIVALRDGQIIRDCTVTNETLVPGYRKEDGVQHIYYFMPLHYYEFNYGYVIMTDDPYLLKEEMLYTYMEKLQQSLKLLRINLRLDALNQNLTRIYDKDPMTGLYNRIAYENKAIPLFEESNRNNEPMMIMFVDINYMKRINDEFGHDQGDNAIKTVAEAIMANTQENWIPVRFGGDEFLLIAPDCGSKHAEKIRQSILDYLDRKNSDNEQPFHISASCGFVVTDPSSENMTLQDYVKEADKLMYESKQLVHKNDSKPRY